MHKHTYKPQLLSIEDGYIADKYYDEYSGMTQSISNWEHQCTYKLSNDGLSGHHRVLHLHNMQIAYAKRTGGAMHNSVSAKECITIAVVASAKDKICFGDMKLKIGDILFFDDEHPNIFIANDTIEFIALTVKKKAVSKYIDKLTNALNKCILDTDNELLNTLNEIWIYYNNPGYLKEYLKTEEKVLTIILSLLEKQIPKHPKLTKGERVALSIRDKVFQHMDGKISIKSLSKEYSVSEQTLQNSFKSLFGFTPQYFLRILKLNIIYHELRTNTSSKILVSKIAYKWGFTHMGRLSSYYKELFGENPSQTLHRVQNKDEFSTTSCVARQEEIN